METIQRFNILYSPIIQFFDPIYFYNYLRRWIILNKKRKGTFDLMTDWYSIKSYFEPQTFKYDNVILNNMRVICVALFFSPIFPLGLFYAIVEISINFILQKYIIIKRSKSPQELSFSFCTKVMTLLEICFLVWAIGALFFDYIFDHNIDPGNYVFLALALL